MSNAGQTRYLRFLGWILGATAVLMLMGYLPTRHLAGGEAIIAMVAGCTIGAVSSGLSSLPLLLVKANTLPSTTAAYALVAMGLRFALAMGLAFAAVTVFSDTLAVEPLLLWVAISYVMLLVFDVLFAMQALRTGQQGTTPS